MSQGLERKRTLTRRIYQIKDDVLILELSRTGTHADLFKK